jgi:Xaa-Pro aminopeptidase
MNDPQTASDTTVTPGPSADGQGIDAGRRPPDAGLESRRAEVEAKQERVGELLADAGAEGLLLIDPANVAWFCGAPLGQGILDPGEWPALFLMAMQRWLVAGNADSQRLFDIHLDGLGFQLKEWQWHGGRDRLLGELVGNRRMASDRLLTDCVPLGPALRRLRCLLTEAERARLLALGAVVAHAVEATCRTLERGQTEEEVAGQVSHRLLHRGITPTALTVAADGRARRHRRPGVTAEKVEKTCLVAATAARGGLHVATARTVSLGPKDPVFRQEYDAASRVVAAQAGAGAPGTALAFVLEAGRKTAAAAGFEHAWRDFPPGFLTGWLPVERPFVPAATYALDFGWAVVWQALVGGAFAADTYLVQDGGPVCVTPVENWPVKRFHVHGRAMDVPDILVRE